MSVDPAAASLAVSAALVEQAIQSELNALAADAEALQAQLSTGDVVNAQVLPSNGLGDLLSVNGLRVAASLPPALQPGDTITAQVTGFDGPRILFQVIDAEQAAAAGPPPPGGTGAPPPGTPPSSGPAPAPSPIPAGTPLLPEGSSVAPPVAVFVAAALRSAETDPALLLADRGTAGDPVPNGPTPWLFRIGEPRGPIPGSPLPVRPAAPDAGPAIPAEIEARLAAARAGAVSIRAPGPLPSAPAGAGPPARVPAAAPAAAPAVRPFVAPVPIVPAALLAESEPLPPAPGPAPAAAAETPAPADPARLLTALRDPVALVRALKLPVTPTNLAAARLAIDTPQRLPTALATLERALPAGDDPRVATLRTLTGFIARIEPLSPQLAAQIAAYVEHAVEGHEPKLAQLLLAHQSAGAPPPAAAPTAPPPPAPAAPAAGTPSPPATGPAPVPADAAAAPPPAPPLPVVALAQIAARAAAIAGDLKEQLFSLIGAPPADAPDDAVPAASAALAAVTAVQLNAAQAAAATPTQIAFALPMWLGDGYAQAHVQVDRDGGRGNQVPLDGDNFHLGFLLETRKLGTVVIDLQGVGRSVTLNLKTEGDAAAQRFADALGRLTERLEALRYTVASAQATVAPPRDDVPPPPPAPADDVSDHPGSVSVRA